MNKLNDVFHIHMSDDHINRVPNLIKLWGTDDKILCLGTWDRGTKPDNMVISNMERLLEIDGMDVKIPYDSAEFKYCLCVGVLNYMKEPHKVASEIHRVLEDYGQLYIEVPFLQPYDPAHVDYYRFTPAGLRLLLKGFIVDEFGIANGPGSTMHWISRIYSALKFDREGTIDDITTKLGDSDYLEADRIFGMAYEDIKETDEVLNYKEHASLIACSYYMLATKDAPDSIT